MDKVSFIKVDDINGNPLDFAIIDKGEGAYISMSKETYDATRTDTPTQAELDAIAKAEADAQAQADAQKASEVAFQTQLAATNAKLMALGLTATDIGTLLNAAKN